MRCVRGQPIAFVVGLLLVALLALGQPRLAGATPPATPSELAAARELFAEGVALERRADWPSALEKFQRALAIVVTPKVRFHVALCLEHTGKTVEAINEFTAARNLASAESADAETSSAAAEHLAALQAAAARLTIVVGADAPLGAVVALDGTALNPSLWGREVPVDVGAHTVTTSATGRASVARTIDVAAGARMTVAAVFGASAPDRVPANVEPSGGSARGSARVATTDGGEPRGLDAHPKWPWPWVAGAVAAAALVASGTFFALRSSTISDLDRACGDARVCTDAQRPAVSRGKTYTTLADVTLALGLAAGGGAFALVLVAPTATSRSTSIGASARLAF